MECSSGCNEMLVTADTLTPRASVRVMCTCDSNLIVLDGILGFGKGKVSPVNRLDLITSR
jgi:hypothetical protein